MTDLLPTLPGHRIVVTAINEDGILGAIGAAATLGRSADLFYAGQGADQSIWKDVPATPSTSRRWLISPRSTARRSSPR